MRCGDKTAHPAHDDIQRIGHHCAGVTADDAVAYAIMGAAEELIRRWHLTGFDDEKLPETARLEMHPAVLNALIRQDVYPMPGPWPRTAPESVLTIPVVTVRGRHGEPHEWRLIVASGVLEDNPDGG